MKRSKRLGGLEQQGRSIVAVARGECDLTTQQLRPRALELVEWPRLGDRKERAGAVERAGLVLGLSSRERAVGPARRLQRQRGGTLQERGCCSQSSAGLSAPRRALKLGGDVLVKPRCRLGEMPSAAIGVDLWIGRIRQRAVDGLPVLRRRRPIWPIDQWVTKRHPRADREQTVAVGRRLHADLEPPGGSPHQYRVADRLRRRHQQQPLGLRREPREPCAEAVLDPPREAGCVQQTEIRPPAQPASDPAAAPTTPAGRLASQRRSAAVPAHPTALPTPNPIGHARHRQAGPRLPASATPRAPRPDPASRRSARPTPPTTAAPRIRAPALRPGQATARHRRRTEAAVLRPPPRAGLGRPTRPETDPVGSPRATRMPLRAHLAEGQEAGPIDPATARRTAATPPT